MRNILCGGAKAIPQLDEKRKRFPVSLPFRRKSKQQNANNIPNASVVEPKSPVSNILVVVPAAAAVASPQNIWAVEPPQNPPVEEAAEAAPVRAPEPAPAPLPVPEAAPAPAPAPQPEPEVQAQPEAQPEAQLVEVPPEEAVAQMAQEDAVIIPDDDDALAAVAAVADNEAAADLARASFEENVKSACTMAVLAILPDICPIYLQETGESLAYDYESVISHILDKVDAGTPYPRRADLKRKRQMSSAADGGDAVNELERTIAAIIDDETLSAKEREERAIRYYNSEERRISNKATVYINLARTLICQAYPFVPHKHITSHLAEHHNCLLPALLDLDNHIIEKGPMGLSFVFKKTKTKLNPVYSIESLPGTIRIEETPFKKEALEEYLAALKIRQLRKKKREEEKQREIKEAANVRKAEREGTLRDCGCCCGDFPMNRMVHCNASELHWFCIDCARRMAENQIGMSKYELTCMSMDGCEEGFSMAQRERFLSLKTAAALDRIEQDFNLRVAGLEGLEKCPFCDYAAVYPPKEINKEFICQNLDCEIASCRLCREQSHIPKTCEEVKRDRGAAARLNIEEAMSEAMIRICNKCEMPFVKDYGCNKMTCSRPGCTNVQCYVCHQTCDYTHFDDTTRGGKEGNCPLFENAEDRHEIEVHDAEEKARQKVIADNPDVDVDLLKINMSEKVANDEKRRKTNEAARQARR
ncbi:hypothetical protein Sste5346_009317 [Sporothrix stenoceras]|uniref:RING-type domain-containing protein n=1 Tax=Sporothrix stenoceras TaxID=5173 RepID=A0ABR3YL42_9PEZI